MHGSPTNCNTAHTKVIAAFMKSSRDQARTRLATHISSQSKTYEQFSVSSFCTLTIIMCRNDSDTDGCQKDNSQRLQRRHCKPDSLAPRSFYESVIFTWMYQQLLIDVQVVARTSRWQSLHVHCCCQRPLPIITKYTTGKEFHWKRHYEQGVQTSHPVCIIIVRAHT